MAIDNKKLQEVLKKREEALKNRPQNNENDNDKWLHLTREIPEAGDKLKVIILPPEEGKGIPGRLVSKHWNLPNADGGMDSIHCLSTYDMECPICNVIEKYKNHSTLIKDQVAQIKGYFNALKVDEDTNEIIMEPKILGGNEHNYYWILSKLNDPDFGDITDPQSCHVVIFTRKTKGGAIDRDIAPKPRNLGTEKEIEKLLSNMHQFDQIWKNPDDEYLKKVKNYAKLLESHYEETVDNLDEINKANDKKKAPKEDPEEFLNVKKDKEAKEESSDQPDCYGNYAKKGEPKEKIRKCLVCDFSDDCESASEES